MIARHSKTFVNNSISNFANSNTKISSLEQLFRGTSLFNNHDINIFHNNFQLFMNQLPQLAWQFLDHAAAIEDIDTTHNDFFNRSKNLNNQIERNYFMVWDNYLFKIIEDIDVNPENFIQNIFHYNKSKSNCFLHINNYMLGEKNIFFCLDKAIKAFKNDSIFRNITYDEKTKKRIFAKLLITIESNATRICNLADIHCDTLREIKDDPLLKKHRNKGNKYKFGLSYRKPNCLKNIANIFMSGREVVASSITMLQFYNLLIRILYNIESHRHFIDRRAISGIKFSPYISASAYILTCYFLLKSTFADGNHNNNDLSKKIPKFDQITDLLSLYNSENKNIKPWICTKCNSINLQATFELTKGRPVSYGKCCHNCHSDAYFPLEP